MAATSGDTPVPGTSEVSLLREVLHQPQRPIRKVLALQHARRIALGLQHAHLTEPPSVPGATLAARYQPAGSDSEIGGDWYDAFTLPDGTLVLDIGDVAGHDLPAATAMTQMRSMLRALAYASGPGAAPADTLAHLDETADLPHCVLPDPGRTNHTRTLAPGDTPLLYTDGLVETPSASLDTGLNRLRHRGHRLPPPGTPRPPAHPPTPLRPARRVDSIFNDPRLRVALADRITFR
ncbi:SpoIIE family protein phosphatase [Streptomyces sp. NPDC035033]|uniref:PP2C family protein-serine/threonine phosphatase n=1 Tax=Streptomyces sp. NPDC035033 TaxID=3155368 RepID=UPI003407AD3A